MRCGGFNLTMLGKVLSIRGLYAILDSSIVAEGDWMGAAERLIEGGAEVLQLRAKGMEAGRLLELSRRMAPLCREKGVMFVINDSVEAARESDAALHIGQDDTPFGEARSIMGNEAVIGVSTHSMAQAEEAARDGADYIGFGPVYFTATKPDALPPRGIGQLRAIVAAVDVPVIAIGGIDHTKMADARAAGAAGAAVISALGGADMTENARKLANAWREEAG